MANQSTQVTIDLSNYKEKVGARVPEGRYKVVVEDVQKDESKQGNDMVNLWLEVVGGPQAGAVLVDRLVLTEKSLFRVVGFMQAIGLAVPKRKLSINIATWKGKVLYVDVADGEPYNGKVKSEVKGYERVVKGAPAVENDPWAAGPAEGLDGAGGAQDAYDGRSSGLDEFAAAGRAGVPQDEAEAALRALPDASSPSAGEEEVGFVGLEDVDLDQLQL